MAKKLHDPSPGPLEAGDDGTGFTTGVCAVCGTGISRRYNTQRANVRLEKDPDVDVFGPDFWYWTHDRRPEDEDAFTS